VLFCRLASQTAFFTTDDTDILDYTDKPLAIRASITRQRVGQQAAPIREIL